jgi:hypothetical protein
MATFAIIRASVPRVGRIHRQVMRARLEEACGQTIADALMPVDRNAKDAIRRALTYRLQPIKSLVVDRTEYKVIHAEAKEAKSLVIDVHAQQRGQQVDYLHIGSLRYNGHVVEWTDGPAVEHFRAVVKAVEPQTILPWGRMQLFDADLRQILNDFLEGKILRLWPGVHIALNQAEHQAVLDAKALMSDLDEGDITLSMLNLEDTKANREALATELAAEFIKAFADIETRAGKVAPNVELLQAELQAWGQRKLEAEALLGVEIPVGDAHVNAELAIADLVLIGED